MTKYRIELNCTMSIAASLTLEADSAEEAQADARRFVTENGYIGGVDITPTGSEWPAVLDASLSEGDVSSAEVTDCGVAS